jgi:hypothetical protein
VNVPQQATRLQQSRSAEPLQTEKLIKHDPITDPMYQTVDLLSYTMYSVRICLRCPCYPTITILSNKRKQCTTKKETE